MTQARTPEEILMSLIAPGAEFEVTLAKIDDVDYRVFAGTPNSMRDFFAKCEGHPDKEFLVYQDERYSFGEVWARVNSLGHALCTEYGIKKGDRIAIAMRNYPEWIFAYMAIISIGGVAVPLNGWWTGEELDFALRDCEAQLLIADQERLVRLKDYLPKLGIKAIAVRTPGELPANVDSFDTVMGRSAGKVMPQVDIDAEDDAAILYTSGSTGYPKGAVSTHRAILTTIMTWNMVTEVRAEMMKDLPQSPYPIASLLTIPLFHVTGCNSLFLLSLLTERRIIMMYRWDAGEALRLIEEERITDFLGVPTMSYELFHHPDRASRDLSSLSNLGSGGAARPADHVRELAEGMEHAPPSGGYGLTETNALGAVISGDEYQAHPTSTGRPTPPIVEMRMVDEDGNDCPTGEAGEIWIKSASNIRGYWNRPDANATSFTDGWFHTGDVGYLDEEGYLYIVDRIKDIVIRGGENVSCLEVEGVLNSHPDVSECVVFAIPDERLGETVAAAASVHPGKTVTPEMLQKLAREHLAAFKAPERIWIHTESLPRIASGKIDKRGIRAAAQEEVKQEVGVA